MLEGSGQHCSTLVDTVAQLATLLLVITSFRHKGLKRFFQANDPSKLNAEHVEKIREALTALNNTAILGDLSIPGFATHPLTGDQKGRYSIKVQGGWCITFEFEAGEAKHVDYENYHKGKHR